MVNLLCEFYLNLKEDRMIYNILVNSNPIERYATTKNCVF